MSDWGRQEGFGGGMALSDQLELVIKKVERFNLPFGHKRDIQSLARFLKEQSLCDLDRRAKQEEISAAAIQFVKRLYEVSILESLNQPQSFWNNLEGFAQKPLQITIGPAREMKNPRDQWNAKDLFQHLLGLVTKEPASTEKDLCRLGLDILIREASKQRHLRNVRRDKEIWITQVHPFLKSKDFLTSLRDDKNLKAKLDYHLTNVSIPKSKREPHP